MSRGIVWAVVLVSLALFPVTLMSKAVGAEGESTASGCLTCHEGIESIGESHEDLECTDCHEGDAKASEKEAAHSDMRVNPGGLDAIDELCALCHQKIVQNVKKSLHATMAGVISGSRYLWAAQDEKNALYAVRAVEDEDGDVPAELGALASLDVLPHYAESDEPIDDYLRNQCLRCHLWTEGAQRAGDYRSSGCSACHVLYADDGLSRSGDKAIPKDEPGHPIRHEMTSAIPATQCLHCHNRGGRTGVSFVGMMESDGYGTPFNADGTKQPKLHGKNYNHLQQDVHYEAGMECIDCHTMNDVHGDGNVYSKREQAVEIECTDCHGDLDRYSAMETSRGTPMENLQKRNDRILLTAKISDRLHEVPQVRALAERSALPAAMRIKGHLDKLECYACHARWAPQCYGCHAKMDMRNVGYDWVDGSEGATYTWKESRSYLRWETPVLGINTEGKVSPFITGCQAIFTQIDEDGETVASNKVFTTADGHSGIAHNPIQPHTVTRRTRTCEDCHAEPKALGLGSGHYDSVANGIGIPFELERIVDEDGRQIQATSHVGARPFNKEEMAKVRRINVCLSCHEETPSEFWNDVKKAWGEAVDTEAHHDVLRTMLRQSADR